MEKIMRLEIGHQSDACMVGNAKSSQHENKMLDNEINIWDESRTQLNDQALTIQRAWRSYRCRSGTEQNANDPTSCETSNKIEIKKELFLSGSQSELDLSEAESGNQDMSVSSPEEFLRSVNDTDDDSHLDPISNESKLLPSYKSLSESATSDGDDEPDIDSFSESVSSDSSETNDLLAPRNELSPLHIYEENDLQNDNIVYKSSLQGKNMEETSDELVKQMRKHNYLTMAQEFASLKKINPDALPFNMHKSHRESLLSDDIPPYNFSNNEENNHSCQTVLSDDSHSGLVPKSDDERSDLAENMLNAERDKALTTLDIMPKTDVPDILKMDGVKLNCSWQDKNYIWDSSENKLNNCNQLNTMDKQPKAEETFQLNVKYPEIKDNKFETSDVNNSASVCNTLTDDMRKSGYNKPKYESSRNELNEVDLPANMTARHAAKQLANSKQIDLLNKLPANMVHKDHCSKPVANTSTRLSSERSASVHRGKSNVHGIKPLANARSHSSGYHRNKLGSSRESFSHRKEKHSSPEIFGEFDVYNIETAMPTIDWVAMEEHLAKAAKEEELLRRQRRNDREEIRRRLATGSDSDEYYGGERIMRKPSLQTRLQSGMNLQICFMNETAGEHETSNSEQDSHTKNSSGSTDRETSTPAKALTKASLNAPSSLTATSVIAGQNEEEMDFVTRQAKLQAEARLALAQAKEMAHMQMEVEKQRKKKSPITEMVGITFPDGRKRANHQVLNEMNVAQLQVIVNDSHTQIENLNEELVRLLLERDDLHMEQDSMLVDIEDLTRYLGAKDRALKENQVKPDALQPLSSKAAALHSLKPLTPKLMLKLKK